MEGAASTDACDPDKVKKYFESKLKEKLQDETERIHSAVDSVKYLYDKTDPECAALMCVVGFTEA